MKNKLFALTTLLILLSIPNQGAPLGTAFTYQGRLTDNSSAANGTYDLRVTLYHAVTNGTGVSGPFTNAGVVVSNGLFTVALDFGLTVFDGSEGWLEIGVRTNGSRGDFTTLSPRQPLTPIPYALHASASGKLLGILPEAQLSPNIPRLDANQSFTGLVNLNAPSGAPFTVGSSGKVNNLNADLLDGLDASAFLLKTEQCVSNLADLRARSPSVVSCVTMLGYRAPGDGGGGNFYWDAVAAGPDDGGTCIVPASNPLVGRWKRLVSGRLSVKWFGAAGDGVTPDETSIRETIRAAATLKRPMHVPPGRYRVREPFGSTQPQIESGEKILMTGAGAAQTTIKFEPDAAQATGFYVLAGGEFILEDLTLEGRTTDSTNVFHHVFAHPGNGTVVKARRCKFTGATTPFKMQGGAYFLELTDCDFDVQGDATVGSFSVLASDGDGGGGAVHFRNCTFKTGDHCMYINKCVSLLVEGCVFERSGPQAYGFHHYGGLGTNNAAYAVIRGSVFKSNVAHQVICTSTIRTLISDCTFIGKAGSFSIQPDRPGIQMTGCRFTGRADAQISDASSVSGEVVAINCRFEGAPTVANVYRHRDSTALWRFIGCDFRNDFDENTAYTVLCLTNGQFEFQGCKFERSPQANGDSQYTRIAGGRFVMHGCRVGGQRSIWITAERNPVVVELWDNVFSSSDGAGLSIQPLGTNLITICGANNRFEGSSSGPNVSDLIGGRVRGWLTPPASKGNAIASAAAIRIKPSESFYDVTGMAMINTIGVEGQQNPEKIFHGPIRLIAGSTPGFILGNSGNIRPRATGPRALHEVVTVFFDSEANGGTGLWYEQ